MNQPETTISETDLTRLLPTCQRCRRLRRKCDTQLPACRLCQKGKVECTFFDHALQQTLPRNYVHELMNRLARLKSVKAAVSESQTGLNGFQDVNAYQPAPQLSQPMAVNGHGQGHSIDLGKQHTWNDTFIPKVSFDKHFIIKKANPTCWQFMGSSSPYALGVELLVHARARYGPVTNPDRYTGNDFALNAYKAEGVDPPDFRPTPPREEMEMLINLYLSTTNVLHGYSDNDAVLNGVQTYQLHHGGNVKSLTGNDAYQFFRTAMICAIASSNKTRHRPDYAAQSTLFYQEALQCIEEVTSDVSPDALEALLLLIMFALLQPRKCDLWKLLDYACRLSVELNYHIETNDEFEEPRSRQRRRSLFWGLYCLERSIGQHLGRPSDLPEEVITAEYPATLEAIPYLDGHSQYALVSHYYRLIYIRSEIFRELYMPVSAPDLPRTWYESRLDQFLAWRREYRDSMSSLMPSSTATTTTTSAFAVEQAPGMGTMTCEMGFDTSICFLFQPLILRALVATKDVSGLGLAPPNYPDVIPRESFDAAVRTIQFYVSVLNAPENTPAGDYPLSIMSAHYIHQATFTIMAHCLLGVDARLPLVTFSSDLSVSPLGPIDFRGLVFESGVAENCLSLLMHVADRFPGMVGAYDVYKNVQDKVMPIILQGGTNAAAV